MVYQSAFPHSNPMISVIIPSFNTPKQWLFKSITSALAQTYSDIEVIVVDDCSDDPFSGLDEEFDDKRIVWLKNEINLGVAATRNFGASKAKGMWLAFLDADDWWHEEKLSLQLEVSRKERVRWVYASAYITTQDEVVVSITNAQHKGDLLKDILAQMVVVGSCSAVMVEKTLFLGVGGFDTAGDLVEDWDLWIRLAKESEASFVDAPMTYIRWYSSTRRGVNYGKLGRLSALQKKHWNDIVRHDLQSVAKAHYFNVKSKLDLMSKNYISAVWYGLLNIIYSKDLSRFSKAFSWIKNNYLYKK